MAVERRRGGGRQLLGLPHGPGGAAGGPGDQPGSRSREHSGIIANPNCSAIIAIMPLWPLHQPQPHQAADRRDLPGGLRRRRGGDGGAARIDPRRTSTARAYRADGAAAPLRLQPVQPQHRRIDPATGYNEEETKVMRETRKIFGDARHPRSRRPACACRCCARMRCVSVEFECESPIAPDEARAILAGAPGVRIVDDPAAQPLPDAERRLGPGRHAGRPHPPRPERPERPLDRAVRRRRPVAERARRSTPCRSPSGWCIERRRRSRRRPGESRDPSCRRRGDRRRMAGTTTRAGVGTWNLDARPRLDHHARAWAWHPRVDHAEPRRTRRSEPLSASPRLRVQSLPANSWMPGQRPALGSLLSQPRSPVDGGAVPVVPAACSNLTITASSAPRSR